MADTESPHGEAVSAKEQDAEKSKMLPALVARYHAVYEGLGGKIDFGGNDELLISASRGYLMIRADHASRQFVGVLLKSSGNLGYLRFRMRNYLKQISRGAA